MARPRKGRRVCCLPKNNVFGPTNNPPQTADIIMSVEEYETLRLLDLEGLTQEETAERMQVARTTVQRIYASARQKVAKALFESTALRIEGGDYELYPEEESSWACGSCLRGRQRRGDRGKRQGQGQGLGIGPGQGRGSDHNKE